MRLIDLFKHHGANEFVKQIGELEIETKEQLENVFKACQTALKKRTRTRQTANVPTVQEVTQYCDERKNGINPDDFVNFYQSKDWMIGKNKIKDWKAAVRTWEGKNKSANQSSPSNRNR